MHSLPSGGMISAVQSSCPLQLGPNIQFWFGLPHVLQLVTPRSCSQVTCVGQDFIHFSWAREEESIRFAEGTRIQQDEGNLGREVAAWQVSSSPSNAFCEGIRCRS